MSQFSETRLPTRTCLRWSPPEVPPAAASPPPRRTASGRRDPRQEAALESGHLALRLVPPTALLPCSAAAARAMLSGLELVGVGGGRAPVGGPPPALCQEASERDWQALVVQAEVLSCDFNTFVSEGVLSDCAAADGTQSSEVLYLTAAAVETWEKWLPVQSVSSVSFHVQSKARGFWFLCVSVFQPVVAVPTLALVSNRFV